MKMMMITCILIMVTGGDDDDDDYENVHVGGNDGYLDDVMIMLCC